MLSQQRRPSTSSNSHPITEYQDKGFEGNGSQLPAAAQQVPLASIVLPQYQPRHYFDEAAMQQLADSVRAHGILQPLLVRPAGERQYLLVAGERRYKAAQALGLTEVPVVVREMTDSEAVHYALVENLQREDLNPLEESEGILQLLAFRLECDLAGVERRLYRLDNQARKKATQSALCSGESEADEAWVGDRPESAADKGEGEGEIPQSALGKSDREIVEQVFADLGRMTWQSFVRTRLPLLKLPPDILEALRLGRIEWTKAKEIAKLESEAERRALLEEASAQSLTLRQIQKVVKEKKTPREQEELQAEMENIFKRAKKFTAWDDSEKCDKLKLLLAELKLLLLGEG
ncbi:ParB/RepB/Spo0J family partition protein [Kamptonema formosum]|uniref:ParB/RepB/Spo0J family partition protein n=1 Tax=Kamptonema formosum TaxID=331992 RepID=UPI00034B2249|nr:ParB/RepB/Spo0J family partition protein [Oscillatoria sp. PCC 10802]